MSLRRFNHFHELFCVVNPTAGLQRIPVALCVKTAMNYHCTAHMCSTSPAPSIDALPGSVVYTLLQIQVDYSL